LIEFEFKSVVQIKKHQLDPFQLLVCEVTKKASPICYHQKNKEPLVHNMVFTLSSTSTKYGTANFDIRSNLNFKHSTESDKKLLFSQNTAYFQIQQTLRRTTPSFRKTRFKIYGHVV